MAHRPLPYAPFKEAYARGCKAIQERHFAPGSVMDPNELDKLDERLEKEALQAIQSLRETAFGCALIEDYDISNLFDNLECGLRRLKDAALSSDAIADNAPVIQWAEELGFSHEREFHFFGRLGLLFHYFRDLGSSLDTGQESALRERSQAQTTALLRQLQEMTDHVGIHLAYKPNVVRRIEALQASLEALQADLTAPIDRESNDGPSLFHGGRELLPRQFARAVSFMAFELFGHLTPPNLGIFLNLKSSTAEDLGFSAWSLKELDSRRKDQRNYIRAALNAGIRKARTHSWVTLPLLEFFSENRGVVFQSDQADK